MTLVTSAAAVGMLALLGSAGAVYFRRRRRAARRRYREHLERALEDGILTPDEARELEALREETALTEAEVRMVARAIYRRALGEATADARITPEEEAGLQRLRLQLGLSDADLDADRAQLQRLRLLARIERGDLPDMDAPIPLSAGERCHWVVRATLGEPFAAAPGRRRQPAGLVFPVADAEPFQAAGPRGTLGDSPGFLPRDLGMLVVTSRRTLFHGARRRATLPHVWLRGLTLFRDGLGLHMADGRPDRTFLAEDAELTGAILLRTARLRQAEVGGAPLTH